MKRDYLKIAIESILIAVIGVFVIDYFSHKFFSNPMETISYFIAKVVFYIIFSFLFLFIELKRKKFIKLLIGGIIVASLWGIYYNILPTLFDYYPFGISLEGLTFLGMGILGTGMAFGIVHILAFIGGYYTSNLILKILE